MKNPGNAVALDREKAKELLQAPFVLALNLFGFLLEFMLELPFMIAFFLSKRTKVKGRKAKGKRVRVEGKRLKANRSE